MNTDAPSRLEELLAHASWVRGLAARLVAGPHDADDIVQEVWRATLAAGPQAVQSPRAWLAGAVRNVVNLRRRGDDRRQRREQATARAEGAPSTAELVAEQELRRRLIEHVDSLPAGEREVVLLRFWQDLPPRQVAKQLGIPVNTVRSRTARALQRLRTQLDEQHGDRKAWCLMLVPLLDARLLRAVGMAPAAGGAKVAVVAAAAIAVAVGGYAVYDSMTGPTLLDLSQATPASEALARFDAAAAVAPIEAVGAERRPATEPSTTTPTFSGTVVDLAGNPIAGAVVHVLRRGSFDMYVASKKITPADDMVATDERGAFTLPPPGFTFHPSSQEIEVGEVTHPDYIAECEWTVWPIAATGRIAMRPAPEVELDIEVVEKDTGLPVPRFGVSLAASWGKSSSRTPGVVIVPDPQRRSLTSLDAREPRDRIVDGRLQRRVRLIEGVENRLSVFVPGCESIHETLAAPAAAGAVVRRRYEVDFDASAKVPGNTVVRGVAVDAVTEQPIAGLGVMLDMLDQDGEVDAERSPSTMTRSDGSFQLGFDPRLRPGRLGVAHLDYERQQFDYQATGPLRLSVMPLPSISLTVTERGQPAPGMHLLVLEGGGRHPERRRVVTDDDGHVQLDRLPADTISLYLVPNAWSADESAIDSTRVRLQRGERRELTFEFSGHDRVDVHGRVVVDRDVAVAVVPVFVPLDGDYGWIQSRSTGRSSYHAGGVRRGRYLVLLTPADDAHRDGPFALHGVVDVQAPITAVLDFVLPTGTVSGRLLGLEDVSGLHVVAVPELPERSVAASQLLDSARFTSAVGAPVDQDGRFELRRIGDGVHELQLRRGAEVLARREVGVAGGLADIGAWPVGG